MTNFRIRMKNVATVVACFAAVLCFSAALTGCGKDRDKHDDPNEPLVPGNIPVNLRTNIKPASVAKSGIVPKVVDDHWEANDKVGLFMIRAGQALTAQGAIYGSANNLQMSIENGSLTVTPTLKYPETGNVDFIAYHPYHASLGAGFTVPVNVAGQANGLPVEVLYSNDITNQAPTDQALTLNFQYSLAKVEITVVGGDNSELTAADFEAMTVAVHGLPTQATLHLADGTLSNIGENEPVTLHRKSATATSATFEMLALPVTNETVTFIFNAAGKLTIHETTVTYESAKLYRTSFALDYPFVTKLNTHIVPRGEEPPQNISIPAGTSFMTMTTTEPIVGIVLRGTGKAFIDWGDGSPLETITLQPFTSIGDDTPRLTHNYTVTTSRTITIYGDNITLFSCGRYLSNYQWIYNQLTALDVSNNTALTYLLCHNNQLTALDVSKNTALTSLQCGNNQLTALDVSNNTALTSLHCGNNQLTTLDVSKNTALMGLACSYNQLTILDVSNNTALSSLSCQDNQLTALDVSNNTALIGLQCENNQLTTLDVTNNTILSSFYCQNNLFSATALNDLFETLPVNTIPNNIKRIYIANNPGTATCDPSIATAKGWNVNTTHQ